MEDPIKFLYYDLLAATDSLSKKIDGEVLSRVLTIQTVLIGEILKKNGILDEEWISLREEAEKRSKKIKKH